MIKKLALIIFVSSFIFLFPTTNKLTSESQLASIEVPQTVYAGHCDEDGHYEDLFRYCDGNEIWEDTEDCDHEKVETCDDDQTCQDAECVDNEDDTPPDEDEPNQCPNWEFDHNECTECGYARTVESQSGVCGDDTRISREHVRDRGCDTEDWCGKEEPPEEEPEEPNTPTPSPTATPNPDAPDGQKPGTICSEKKCVYSEVQQLGLFQQTKCFIGHCLDGSENCDFNDNCGYVDGSCDESGQETECYVAEPILLDSGAGDVGNAECRDDNTYCDSSNNTLVWKHGGRKATTAEKNGGLADSEGCVYAYTPQGSCGGGNSNKPTITGITTAPDLNCKSVGNNSFECNTPSSGSSIALIPRVNSPQDTSPLCYWKINTGNPDLIARGCNLNRNYTAGDYFSVAPTNKFGQGGSINITFASSQNSNAPSCPAQGSNIKVSSGTKANPEGNSGHCGINYPQGYSWCTNPKDPTRTNASFALDVGNGGTDVKFVLPAIQGKNVNWQKVSGPYDAGDSKGDMGICIDYQGNTSTGEIYYLHGCHMLATSVTNQSSGGPSGTVVANTLTTVGMNGRPHLHFTISKKQASGNWQMQEPNATLSMCR